MRFSGWIAKRMRCGWTCPCAWSAFFGRKGTPFESQIWVNFNSTPCFIWAVWGIENQGKKWVRNGKQKNGKDLWFVYYKCISCAWDAWPTLIQRSNPSHPSQSTNRESVQNHSIIDYGDLKQTRADQGRPSQTMTDQGRARYSRVQPGTAASRAQPGSAEYSKVQTKTGLVWSWEHDIYWHKWSQSIYIQF